MDLSIIETCLVLVLSHGGDILYFEQMWDALKKTEEHNTVKARARALWHAIAALHVRGEWEEVFCVSPHMSILLYHASVAYPAIFTIIVAKEATLVSEN